MRNEWVENMVLMVGRPREQPCRERAACRAGLGTGGRAGRLCAEAGTHVRSVRVCVGVCTCTCRDILKIRQYSM